MAMTNKKCLGIIGGGRFGRLAENLAIETGEFEDVVFFDDFDNSEQKTIGTIADIETMIAAKRISHLSVAVGYKHFHFRQEVYERFRGKIAFANLIHPSAWVSKGATLGEGVSIYSMVNVETGASIGSNVSVFNQSSITHDVHIADHSFLSVGVAMGGGVQIGKRVFVGVNASIVNDISIGDDSIVCGGTFLTKSLPEQSCVIGNPFREIERVYL